MTSTEEKLARELELRVSDSGYVQYPDEQQWYKPTTRDTQKLWRKCLELTKQRECGGTSLSPREWLDARYGSTPPVGEWQWTDEIVEAYASSRLAQQCEECYRKDLPEGHYSCVCHKPDCLEKFCEPYTAGLLAENATLRAEVERLKEAVHNIYYAAAWHADRSVDEQHLWTELRDAAGFPAGQSPDPSPTPWDHSTWGFYCDTCKKFFDLVRDGKVILQDGGYSSYQHSCGNPGRYIGYDHKVTEQFKGERDALDSDMRDAAMFLRIVLTRKDVTTLNCLKPKIADWLKRKGYDGSVLREEYLGGSDGRNNDIL